MPGQLNVHLSCWKIALLVAFSMLWLSSSWALGRHENSRSQQLQQQLHRVLSKPGLSLGDRLNALVSLASNDHERAWLIYRWVTHHFRHDARLASRIGNPKNHSLDELYQFAGGSCAVYAEVTHRLMAQAGLEVKTIYGIAKGGAATTRRNGKAVNHVWNAVKVNGQWRVIDATWGAGYVGRQGFQRDQSDLFFLMPPEQAVLSHFDSSDELGHQKQFNVSYELFARLPEDALYAASMGFDAKAILDVQRKHFALPLVGTFDQPPGAFKVIQAPVTAGLPRTQQKFQIESVVYEELMLLQGKKWMQLHKQGFTHSLTIQPDKGELIVMGRKPKQHDYEALLAYTVK